MNEALRLQYLEAMGVAVWRPRRAIGAMPAAEIPAPAAHDEQVISGKQPAPEVAVAELVAMTSEQTASVETALSPQRPESEGAATAPMPAAEPATVQPDANPVATMDWPALEEAVAGCRACGLCQRRSRTVFGVGDRNAEVMFIGEGPGADEDRQGEPFVGRAGQLLNRMLAAAGLKREQIYIANIVKCRPPNNRDPSVDEAGACRAYLERQIALVQPRLIVCLGRVPATNLLNTTESVGRLRGRLHQYGPARTALLVTYHPSYYLRSPEQKAKGWQDLQRMLEFLGC